MLFWREARTENIICKRKEETNIGEFSPLFILYGVMDAMVPVQEFINPSLLKPPIIWNMERCMNVVICPEVKERNCCCSPSYFPASYHITNAQTNDCHKPYGNDRAP